MYVNYVILGGNLTADPDYSMSKNGVAVARFTVAANKPGKNGNTASFVKCRAFGSIADYMHNWMSKGDAVLVIGELNESRWQGQDGKNRIDLMVIANSVHSCSKRETGENAQNNAAVNQNSMQTNNYTYGAKNGVKTKKNAVYGNTAQKIPGNYRPVDDADVPEMDNIPF